MQNDSVLVRVFDVNGKLKGVSVCKPTPAPVREYRNVSEQLKAESWNLSYSFQAPMKGENN